MSGFWRTGDYRLFNNGRDVAVSRRDYNQNHSTNTAEALARRGLLREGLLARELHVRRSRATTGSKAC